MSKRNNSKKQQIQIQKPNKKKGERPDRYTLLALAQQAAMKK